LELFILKNISRITRKIADVEEGVRFKKHIDLRRFRGG